jgi:hypothetical protein
MIDTRLDAWFAPLRFNAHRTVMLVRDANGDRDVQIAAITAILEGTMAGATQTLGTEAAFNLIQPLADKIINPALGAQR